MKKIVTLVIVVLSFLLEWTEVVAKKGAVVKVKQPKFRFPNTWQGRKAAAKLRRTPGFEMVTIILDFGRGKGLKIERGMPVILSILPNPNASVEAYLVIPHNHGKAVVLMNGIVTKCTGNEYVSLLVIDLDAASDLIENYNKAHGAARKVTLDLAVAALEVFMAKFQAFADLPANKANSIVIIQSGGFHVKGVGGNHASTWDAASGKLPGEVDMTFITGVGTCCYDNWYSVDNINWIRMDPTIYNHATLTGLIPGNYVWVRYQLCDAHGPEGFHPAIRVRVAPIV